MDTEQRQLAFEEIVGKEECGDGGGVLENTDASKKKKKNVRNSFVPHNSTTIPLKLCVDALVNTGRPKFTEITACRVIQNYARDAGINCGYNLIRKALDALVSDECALERSAGWYTVAVTEDELIEGYVSDLTELFGGETELSEVEIAEARWKFKMGDARWRDITPEEIIARSYRDDRIQMPEVRFLKPQYERTLGGVSDYAAM